MKLSTRFPIQQQKVLCSHDPQERCRGLPWQEQRTMLLLLDGKRACRVLGPFSLPIYAVPLDHQSRRMGRA
ncbi:Hypothetical predicted protein, partial [Pelobates cultripes]